MANLLMGISNARMFAGEGPHIRHEGGLLPLAPSRSANPSPVNILAPLGRQREQEASQAIPRFVGGLRNIRRNVVNRNKD
jgi:hypothetical protein